jgi:hypothetical protein
MVTKLEKMQAYIPNLLRPKTNVMNRGVLTAWASEDDKIVQSIKDAKEQLFILTAQLQFLDALSSNYGVFRPTVFNLSDILFRKLVPALSFEPKQVLPTFQLVLDVFFGENNPQVSIHEIRPNEIEITIPSTVPALRRGLRGAHHFHNYSGNIVSIDNFAKEIVIDLFEDEVSGSKVLTLDELAGGFFGQGFNTTEIVSNDSGTTGVTLQFSPGDDLSIYSTSEIFVLSVPTYPGGYIPDETSALSVLKQRGTLGQVIPSGSIQPTLTMNDASGIPNSTGFLVFGFGSESQETQVKYFGRPNNQTLFIDPSYVFQFDHSPDEIVNVMQTPYNEPRIDGSDFSVYIVGVTAARLLAQQIIESLKASGIVINFTVLEPVFEC